MYKDILDNDDIKALEMLLNEEKMSVAEKRHYLLGAGWDLKLNLLEEDDLFDENDLKAIKKLVNQEPLSPAEKRHYILGSNIKEKVKELSEEAEYQHNVSNIIHKKARNVPNIEDVKVGDQILMKFEEKGMKDHYWCDVKEIDTTFTKDNKPMLTVSINTDLNKEDMTKMVTFGMDGRNSSTLLTYCKTRYDNLELGEKAYSKRALEVKPAQKPKRKNRMRP